MIRATSKGVSRVVYGGIGLGDLVVTVRNDNLTIKQKGKRSTTASTTKWSSVVARLQSDLWDAKKVALAVDALRRIAGTHYDSASYARQVANKALAEIAEDM